MKSIFTTIGTGILLVLSCKLACYAQKDITTIPKSLSTSTSQAAEAEIKLPTLMILLDASKSMAEYLPSKNTKIDSVRASLHQSLSRISSNTCVGLRVFGQRITGDKYIDCQQSVLLIPPSVGNRRSIFEHLREIKPAGLTPLEHSLKEIVEKDLRQFPGKKTIVLITDGMETCGGNPWEYVKQFPDLKIHVKINVVGLGMHNNPSAIRQLKRIAETTHGNFVDVDTTSAISQQLTDFFQAASKSD